MTTSSSPIPSPKTHNLAGARLGFCIARPALIADMNRVKFSYSPYNVNAMTQLRARRRSPTMPYFADVTAKVIAERTHTTDELRRRGFTVFDRPKFFVRDHGPYALCGNF